MIQILRGDVFEQLPKIPKGSIDCIVTSPPYWKLRSYLPKDHPLKKFEIGQEDTVREYVAKMVAVFDLVRDTMADHATCWLNIGDTYSNQGGSGRPGNGQRNGRRHTLVREKGTQPADGIPAGNLCLIPQRLAIALQDAGWMVRSVVIWQKPACMPASLAGWMWVKCRVKVKGKWDENHPHPAKLEGGGNGVGWHSGNDHFSAQWQDCPGCKKCKPTGGWVLRRGSWRPTSSYEPILFLAKSAKYFADGEAVKTPPKAATVSRDQYTRVLDDADEQYAVAHDHERTCNGANLRDAWLNGLENMTREELVAAIVSNPDLSDLWSIPAEPLKEAHYAAFPTWLVELCLKASTSEKGYCPTCGSPWVRRVKRESYGDWRKTDRAEDEYHGSGSESDPLRGSQFYGQYRGPETLDWRPSCKCEGADQLEPRPARVLDPFCGSGRTGVCATRMFHDFVGVELFDKFADMAERVLREDMPLFNS